MRADFNSVQNSLRKLGNPKKAILLQRFFKTGKGEYAEGDIFLGLTVPQVRSIVKKYKDLGLTDVKELLKSRIHEERLTALLILIEKYQKGDEKDKKKISHLYLAHTAFINNWDLVDLSAHKILGHFLDGKDDRVLYRLAKSKSLWERRIAIIATAHFIGKNQFNKTLEIAEVLLRDSHDLIHKAVGWMLREVGKRDLAVEERFLKKYYRKMPRTMLRYAIERFEPSKRTFYLTTSR